MLRACGDSIFPVQRISPLPGGGKAYTYVVSGHQVTFTVAPRNLV
jgi:hypothetical protein